MKSSLTKVGGEVVFKGGGSHRVAGNKKNRGRDTLSRRLAKVAQSVN